MTLMDTVNVYPLENLTGPCRRMRRKARKEGVQAMNEKMDLQVAQVDMFLFLRRFLNISLKVYNKM